MKLLPNKLAQYIKDLGLSFKETSQSFMFNCPLCGGKDKLYIRKSDGRFRCFKCVTDKGFSGNVEYAIIELTDLPLKQVKESLYGSEQERASYVELVMKDFLEEGEEIEDEVVIKPPVLTWPYHCLPIDDSGSQNGAIYLQKRGIPLDIANVYQIRYSPQNRAVAFPVYVGEDLLGWQYRTIDPNRFLIDDEVKEKPKTWSSPNLPRDKVFMFANRLIGVESAVLCEGPIDAIKAHYAGGNIAAMGKSISSAHIATLLRSGIKKVYVGLDQDAFTELDSLLYKLGDDVELYRVNLPESDKEKVDLGSLSMEDALKAIQSSERMVRGKLYLWFKPLTF
jgi:hypothetical protein